MSEKDFLNYVLNEYQRVLNEFIEYEEEYERWLSENPDRHPWEYVKPKPSKVELERYGILARKTMINIEKEI